MPDTEAALKEVRAAFACEPRLDLHRYPIHMDFSDGDLTLEGEVGHVAAKKPLL